MTLCEATAYSFQHYHQSPNAILELSIPDSLSTSKKMELSEVCIARYHDFNTCVLIEEGQAPLWRPGD
jgi:hypothetical protein